MFTVDVNQQHNNQNQTAQPTEIEFIFDLIIIQAGICIHQSDASDTQAEPSLCSRPQGVINTGLQNLIERFKNLIFVASF